MHRFVSSRSFAVLAAPILLSVLVFNHLKKKKKSAEKESTEGVSTRSSSPLIPAGGGSQHYDVFLSFRGSDTKKFTDHLYHRLVNVGISIFRDGNNLKIGEDFNSEILNAIMRSKISIPIISENYASGKWCLRELIYIMDCKKRTSHMVLPIFYKVNPLDVRYLKGNFGKAFHSHEKYYDENDIQERRQALREVSYLKGWESEKIANGHEGELIELVVETVLSELRKDFQLDVPKQLVGLDGHLKRIMNWTDNPSDNARMIGIYGMDGIGKTTLAKCIYNQLLNEFLHVSFLPDVREITKHHGIPHLQSQLISDILQSKIQVSRVDDGVNIIKSRFKGKKVLIFLDDIDDKHQLDALAGDRDWFSTGSLIIVTTRNKAVLDQSEFEVDYIYELDEMDGAHSFLLFNRHAFHMDHSPKDLEGISRVIISTIGGLPLIVKVIGSYLYGKANLHVWQDMLEQLREQPHRDVQKILKISYDALEDGHKEIFLDIACFFIGQRSEYAIYMWNNCGFYASQAIEELKLRCLINIGDSGEFKMHNQLRDLGRAIVCQEPLERRSRLWDTKEAFRVTTGEKGTNKIQAIGLHEYHRLVGHLQIYANEQLNNLQGLRFLQLRGAALIEDSNNSFSELRWLQWFDMEPNMSFLTTNLHLPKLVVLQLSGNEITEHWQGWITFMVAKRLKVLDLASCEYLRCTPDLSTFIELEILILKECLRLEVVHPSIGKVKSLISLDLSGCGNLKELPSEVGKLEELKELILDGAAIKDIPVSIGFLRKLEKLSAIGCRSLREMPSSIGDLQNLQHLDISNSAIEKLPGAIKRLKNLRRLTLRSCLSLKGENPSEIGDLSSIEILDLARCNYLRCTHDLSAFKRLEILILKNCDGLERIHPSIGKLKSLISLDLTGSASLKELPRELGELEALKEVILDSTGISKIPTSIGSLKKLEKLSVFGCRSLREIPSSIGNLQNLQYLDISHSGIEKLPSAVGKLKKLRRLSLKSCLNLKGEIPSEIGDLSSLKILDLAFCNYLRCTLDLPTFKGLEILNLKHCDELERVHPTMGKLKSLVSLDLSDCGSLKELPKEVGELEELKELILDSTSIIEMPTSIGSLRKLEKLSACFCQSLKKIPDSIGDLQNLQDIDLSHSAIEKLPSTIGMLKKVRRLSLKFCYRLKGEIPSEIGHLSSLKILDISSTRTSKLPKSIRNLSSLQRLSLWGCYELWSLPKLPSGLTNLLVSCQSPMLPQLSCLIHLEELDLSKCVLLEYIPKLPSRLSKLCVASCHKLILPKFEVFNYLKELIIKHCDSIERLDLSMLKCLKQLHVEDCCNLGEIQSHDNLEFLEEIVIDCCKSIERLILLKLQRLKQLKANYCDNLVEIQGLDKAEFLEVLDISYCESIERLPDLSCSMTLKELKINGCCSLRGLESLERFLFCRSIYISGCQSLEKLPNLSKFENLENFTMRHSLGVAEIPGVEKSRSLKHIDVTGCKSMEILRDLSGCDKLQSLVVQDCKKLTQLRGLEKLDLVYLDISGCDSLETIPNLSRTHIFRNYERAQDEVPDGNIILQ